MPVDDMHSKNKLSQQQKNLICRYLVWFYKAAKEDLDKIDRYFTQAYVDEKIIEALAAAPDYKLKGENSEYRKKVDDLKVYFEQKKSNALKKKFSDEKKRILDPQYVFLQNRFKAVESAIRYFLGVKSLKGINRLYEQEMTTRILQAREHT